MKYTEEGMYVGPASHGLGVFSLRAFRRDELIGPIEGTVMEEPSYESQYCMEVDRVAMEPVAPFRYLNHSCRPNCALVELEVDFADGVAGVTKLWLETLAEIAAGEEMTIEYNWPADAAIPCGCGSPNCRGWIVAAEEREQIEDKRGEDKRGTFYFSEGTHDTP